MSMILITGSSGFIGSNLTRKLNLENLEFIRASYDTQINDYVFKFGEFFVSKNELPTYLAKVTTILHVGAWTPKNRSELNRLDFSQTNIAGTAKLLSLEFQNLTKFIFTSTTDIYPTTEIITESTRPSPESEYSWSKLINENQVYEFARKQNIACLILRIGNVYGPGDSSYDKVLQSVIKSVKNNKSIKISGGAQRHFLYIHDLVEYLYKSITCHDITGWINIVGAKPYKLYEVMELVHELFPDSKNLVNLFQNNSTDISLFDVGKMNNIFNILQTELRTGLLGYLN